MADPRQEWELIAAKDAEWDAVAYLESGRELEPGERVVVARPSDIAKRIAEGIREQTKHRYWGADTRLAIADWIEREWGDER